MSASAISLTFCTPAPQLPQLAVGLHLHMLRCWLLLLLAALLLLHAVLLCWRMSPPLPQLRWAAPERRPAALPLLLLLCCCLGGHPQLLAETASRQTSLKSRRTAP